MKYAKQFRETRKRLREYAALSPCGSIPLKEKGIQVLKKIANLL